MRTSSTINEVAQSFGAVAHLYDQRAEVQRQAADQFVELLRPIADCVDGPILEFGCGTGFITERTATWWPHLVREVTDVAPEMVAVARDKLASRLPAATIFRVLDIEQFRAQQPYGLILSGLTVQWMQDLRWTLESLGMALQPGGFLAVSYFDARSFPQWKALCREAGVAFTGNPLPEPAAAGQLGPPFTARLLHQECHESYPSPMAFFRHLKLIGAGARPGKTGSAAPTIKKLEQAWALQRRTLFPITYGITYALIQRLA